MTPASRATSLSVSRGFSVEATGSTARPRSPGCGCSASGPWSSAPTCFRRKGRELDHALRVAPVIHASDTATVLALRGDKQLRARAARPARALLSGANRRWRWPRLHPGGAGREPGRPGAGFFIVTAIYMAAEKASAAILADAARGRPRRRPALLRPSALLPSALTRPSRRPGDPMSTETPGPTSISGVRAAAAGRLRRAPDAGAPPVPAPRRCPGADYRRTLFWRIYDGVAQAVDHKARLGQAAPAGRARRPDRRPQHPAAGEPARPVDGRCRSSTGRPVPPRTPAAPGQPAASTARTTTSTTPTMGMAGARFGRNIPLDQVLPVTREQLMEPNPREVSRRLLTRDDVPAGRRASTPWPRRGCSS